MHKMSKAKASFYEIFNKSEDKSSVDILIYGAIPELDWDTWELKNTAEKFVKDFKGLEQEFDRINIHINSPGGSLYHAFPIYNVIANSTKDVHTYNDGLAASAAGKILLAGKTIHSAKNAFLMIHNASGACWGNAAKMRDTADMIEKYEGVVAQRFAEKSGMSKEDFTAKYLNGKDHFLTAEEALEGGFIDVIENYESEDAPPSDIKKMAFGEVMNLYKKEEKESSFFEKITNHILKTFRQKSTPEAVVTVSTDQPNPTPTTTNTDMNFDNAISLLAKETLTAEDITAIKADIEAYRNAGEKFTQDEVQAQIAEALEPVSNEVTALATAKADLENQLSAITTEKETITAEKTKLETENNSIKITLEAYRKSGVKIDNQGGADPDKIEGADTEDDFYSEADEEVKKMRAQLK
jgi:ATP-dependent Clp protease, protease subunit